MEIAFDVRDGVAVAAVPVDELDASNAGEFKRDIAPVLQANAKLVLDLSRLRFVDSSGLGAMLSCLRQLSAKSGDLKLCGMSKQVRALFELVRMHRIFDIQEAIQRHARYPLGQHWRDLSERGRLDAVALAVRDQMVDCMFETEERYQRGDPKRLYYLSIEFLIGQSLGNNLLSGTKEEAVKAFQS